MLSIKRFKRSLKKGFSLQETLIWVGIVGIFVSLIGISGMMFWDRSKVRAAKQEMGIISSSLLDYYDSKGKYPSDDEGLKALADEGYVTAKTKFADPWKNPYIYTVTNDGAGYVIKSLGSDKKPGGEGTAADITMSSGKTEDENSTKENE